MTLTTQFYTLIAMIGMGSYFGASLDTYQLFLKRPKRSRWLVFIHDLLFWTFQALFIFYILFRVNQGELRFYSFLALLCGFAAYQALFKKSYMFILKVIISFVLHTIRFIIKLGNVILIKPIIGIFTFLFFLVKIVLKGLLALVRFCVRVIIIVIKVTFAPIVWIIRQIYKLFPEVFTNKLEKLYNQIKGFFIKIKNYITNVIEKWKKKD